MSAPSTGLGPILYLPAGAQAVVHLTWSRADSGLPIDLSGATKIEFLVRRDASAPDADAIINKQLADFVVLDAPLGLARLTFVSPADAEAFGRYFYLFRATLSTGEVVMPDQLRGAFYNDPEMALTQYINGECLTRLDSPVGSVTTISPDMGNFIVNRYDLVGLYGGTSTKLDGLASDTLAALPNGSRLQVGFAGRIIAQYVMRAKAGGEVDTPASGRIVVFDNDTTRVAELEFVLKEALPAAWDEVAQLWCQVTGYGGAASLITPGFTIPA